MKSNLSPLTPTLAAYAAGRTIEPLWVSPTGRAFYPIAGGAEDPDPDPAGGGQDPDPAVDPAKPDKGFPENTPVKDMTIEQRAAYYEHQARKHEDRNKDLLKITGGKYGNDLKALLDERENLLKDKLTDSERAIEDAKSQVRDEVTREFGPKSVRTAFELLLSDMDEQERNDAIDLLDLTKFLNDAGDVDTAKVRKFADTLTAPADKDAGNQRQDYGAGRRGHQAKSGVAAGADLYATSRKKSPSTT